MKIISKEKLIEILKKHELWLSLNKDGVRADLREANLCGADLRGANLRGANLFGAKNINVPMSCPEEGSFIGFKKCRGNLIVKLQITKDALRCSGTGRKCRCSKAKVLSITNIDGSDSNIESVASKHDPNFIYTIGKTVKVTNFDMDRFHECSTGIHFFITREEAVNYQLKERMYNEMPEMQWIIACARHSA